MPSASITNLDQWVTYDFDWVYPTTGGTDPLQLNYGSFRLYGGDGTTLSTASHPNPGGYFDNCQISSAEYRNDLHGFVKDSSGNPIAGAAVVLSGSFAPNLQTNLTLADGSYTFSFWAPYDSTFTVDATKPLYTSTGPQALAVSATSGAFPNLTMTKDVTYHITGTVTGLPAGKTAQVTATSISSGDTTSTNTAADGTYSLEVSDNDMFTVSASAFPFAAASQTASVYGANATGINFALTDSTLVWYKFDGNTLDASGHGNDGGLLGGATIVPHGRVGNSCLSTVAATGGLQISNSLAGGLTAYTMSAWVRCTTAAEWQTLYANPNWGTGDVNNPLFSQSGQMLCSVNGTTPTDHWYPAAWGSSGQWHFMTVAYDSVAMTETFYFDGVKVRTDTLTATVPVNFTANATLGCWSTPGNRQLTGEIDDFRICSAAASDADVAALYASYPPLVTHTIAATADAGCTISPAGSVSVMDRYDQSFTFAPALGYRLASVTVDGVAQTLPLTSYTYTNVTADHTISVTSVIQPTHSIAGKVVDNNGAAIAGASVYISGSPNATVAPLFTATTAADGTYSQANVPEGTVYVAAAKSGKWNSPDRQLSLLANATGVDFVLQSTTRNIPAQSDLLFSVVTESLPASGNTGPWATYAPAGLSLTAMGTPTVETVRNLAWERNNYGENDGYSFAAYTDPIPCSGATLVAAVIPRRTTDSWWSSVVNFFYNDLMLNVRNSDGMVQVVRHGTWTDCGVIPEGVPTILCAVIRSTGGFDLYANGQLLKSVTDSVAYTQMTPGGWDQGINQAYTYAYNVNVGRNNPDGWTVFNGNLGDVLVYTKALSAAERHTLEADLGAKFGVSVPQYAPVSGLVTDAGAPVPGAIVRATQTADPSQFALSEPAAADGSYRLECSVGHEYRLSASALPPGRTVVTAPAPFTPTNTAALTGMNLLLGPDPNYDPDLFFSLRSSAFAAGADWPAAYPLGAQLTRQGNPTTATLNGQQWVNNHADGDGFTYTNVGWNGGAPGSLYFNGGSIVVAARPFRYSSGNAYQQLVSVLLNQFSIGIQRDSGQLRVWRGGTQYNGPTIPNGQVTVLSFVVQPTGEFVVYTNGVQAMTETSTFYFSTLIPADSYMTDVNVGNGWHGDSWSSFNGQIGDVYVYQVAIDDAKRTALESSLMTKYGTAPVYTITATTNGLGGSITPAGAVAVPASADQTFTIATDYGYVLNSVIVDGASVGAVSSYTFTNVASDHTIAVSWNELPSISGTVSGPSGPIYSAFVSLSTNADGSSPLLTRTSDKLGQYKLTPPASTGSYYLVARKGGYVTSPVKTVVMSGASVTGQDFSLTKSAGLDPLVVLDAATLTPGLLNTWTNTGSLGGSFTSYDATSAPSVGSSYGQQAVEFNQLDATAASRQTLVGSMRTPAQITGSSDWTISALLYRADMDNPNTENAYMCWAARDNPPGWPGNAGTTAEFCYRNNTAYVHWGNDRGFSTVPAAGAWHKVTITYDGTTEKIFVDGVLDSSDARALNLHANGLMMVGGANYQDLRTEDQYWRFTGAIAKLEIFDQALTEGEIASRDLPAFRWAGPNNGSWSTPANWNSAVPGFGNIAIFSDSATAGATVQLDTFVSVKGLLFNSQAPSTTLASTSGNALTLDDGTVTDLAPIVTDGGAHTISAAVNAVVGISKSGSGKVTLSGTVNLGSGGTANPDLIVSGTGSELVLAGPATGAYGTRVTGSGTLTIKDSYVTAARDQIIGDAGTPGNVVLSGNGSWTQGDSGVFVLGNNDSALGTVTINDNAVLDLTANGPLWLAVGWGSGSSGTVVQNGGLVKPVQVAADWRTSYGPGVMLGQWTEAPCHALYSLNGGILQTPSIGNLAWSSANGGVVVPPSTFGSTAILNLNGGTLLASAGDLSDNTNAVAEGTAHLIFNTTHTWVQAGGARIDTAFTNSIAVALEHDPSGPALDGGLTKLGTGVLTLLAESTYTGPTKVQAGVLACATNSALAGGALDISTGAQVALNYAGSRNIAALSFNGAAQPNGTYGATGSGAAHIDDVHFAGTGTVTVGPVTIPVPVLPPGGFTHSGGVPTFTFNTVAGYKYRVVYKNALSDASWQELAPGFVLSTGAPMTVSDTTAAGQPKRFYRIEAAAP